MPTAALRENIFELGFEMMRNAAHAIDAGRARAAFQCMQAATDIAERAVVRRFAEPAAEVVVQRFEQFVGFAGKDVGELGIEPDGLGQKFFFG